MLKKRRIVSVLIFCVLIPIIVILGYFFLKGSQYYIVSLMIVVCSMFPFFYSLERKKLQVRELVVMASVIAIAVSSRAAFFFFAQVKPMCAVLVIAAISFGAEFGFVSAALAMFLSNFIYGQGFWTAFQMLAMGLTVFLCAALSKTFKVKNRFVLGAVSAVLCLVVYGIIADMSSVFMMATELSLSSVAAIYLSGLPFNLIHAVTTGVIVTAVQPVIGEKLERIKIKYGLFGEKE